MNILTIILFGFTGGIVRALVGLLKNKVFLGKQKFKPWKFIITILISGIIGLFCGLLTVEDYRLALLAGYAGTHFIQSMYKVFK